MVAFPSWFDAARIVIGCATARKGTSLLPRGATSVMSDLYDQDFHAWANQQATLLRSGRVEQADLAHIAEEIATIGRGERNQLTNRLAVFMAHLMKWRF